jgi:hypothetical protein
MLDCPKEILIGIQGKSWDPEEYDGKKYIIFEFFK